MSTTLAVVLTAPQQLELRRVDLSPSTSDGDVLIAVEWTGISTGTECLLFNGRMPPFPGMGYPLVPGYETVGRVVEAGPEAIVAVGQRVFVPGASCFGELRGLFGGAASRLRVPSTRVTVIPESLGERGILLALAATAQHAIAGGDGRALELIVGHGIVGRLLARLAVAYGMAPVVWEKNPRRRAGAHGYSVVAPEDDVRSDYRSIYDASGDSALLEPLIRRVARGGEIVLAGFYAERLAFDFPIAFIKELRLRVAAEWTPQDLAAVADMVTSGRLDLDGLITHRRGFEQVLDAYPTAFGDPDCLKMVVDWRECS
ncbi:MAG: chlorophyll synthesis pathway protein BchC [Deltaproteobacteria bacterium]|nr:chlorophyll synthesis pathway protein BchC [Nannocystaceae bacterium]